MKLLKESLKSLVFPSINIRPTLPNVLLAILLVSLTAIGYAEFTRPAQVEPSITGDYNINPTIYKAGDISYIYDRFGRVGLAESMKFELDYDLWIIMCVVLSNGANNNICNHPQNNYFNTTTDTTSAFLTYDPHASHYKSYETAWASCRDFSKSLKAAYDDLDLYGLGFNEALLGLYSGGYIDFDVYSKCRYIKENAPAQPAVGVVPETDTLLAQ